MTTDLDAAIRAKLAGDHPIGHCPGCEGGDPCDVELGNAAARAVITVLDRHKIDDDDHLCIDEIVGYSVQRWYRDEPCPTVLAVAEALGIEVDRD